MGVMGLNPHSTAKAAGLNPAAVRNILRRDDAGASMKTLRALAPVLGVSVEWLSVGDELPLAPATVERLHPHTAPTLACRYEVGGGYWVSAEAAFDTFDGSMVLADPRYMAFAQWLERSIATIDPEYPANTLIHVVDPVAVGNAPRPGDHVVILRTRHGGAESERSIRSVLMTSRGLQYPSRTSDEVATLGELDGVVTSLEGLVLGSYRSR